MRTFTSLNGAAVTDIWIATWRLLAAEMTLMPGAFLRSWMSRWLMPSAMSMSPACSCSRWLEAAGTTEIRMVGVLAGSGPG